MNFTVDQTPKATHPYMFQPSAERQQGQQQQQYQSGEDFDSPPSLTNSSESPRSTSEEGGSSSPRTSSFDESQSVRNARKNLVQGNNTVNIDLPTQQLEQSIEEEEDTSMSVQAMSPNWESVFASTAESSENMDLTNETPVPAPQIKQETASSSSSDSNGVGESNRHFNPAILVPHTNKWQSSEDPRTTDDAMFESLIQQEKFDQGVANDAREDESVASEMSGRKVSNVSIKSQSSMPGIISNLSSRRNSTESENATSSQVKIQQNDLQSGSHYDHTLDSDLPSSSQVVVRPPAEELKGLQLHVHGIPASGAKSRVETQIRLRLELVRPVQGGGTPSTSNSGFERIGNFDHVKLPPLTGTKRRSKKHKQADIDAEKALFMDAAVVCATPPHERIFVCRSCQQREKKRAQRRKSGAKKDDGKEEDDHQFTLEDYNELGVDPQSSNARAEVKRRSEEEDEKRVVVFNCGNFVGFEDGQCVLPTRITCYCRHHREKTGFCLIFTMRDYRGNLIASGSTPPIMITDDHKSVAAAAAAAAAAASSSADAANIRRVDKTRSRAASSEIAADETQEVSRSNTTTSNDAGEGKINAGRKARRAQKSKPYSGKEARRASRRSGTSTSLSTGQNTPAIVHSPTSPQSDMNDPDFWSAFAAMANVAGSPQASSRASQGVQTPHNEVTSPLQPSQPLSIQGMPAGHDFQHHQAQQQSSHINAMQQWAAGMAAQGSISSQTLNVYPQSIPGFDLNAFMQSIQNGRIEGDQTSVQNLLTLARSLPVVSLDGQSTFNQENNSNSGQSSNVPAPSISKLIPGEGPTSGGIEVTVLGENFVDGLTCYFGDIAATSTRVWGSNTLLCLLPPSASPGPVAVTVKGPGMNGQVMNDRYNNSLQLFTYIDATDRALMELALQVVGLQMTGQMQSARDVAMRVVGSGPNQGMTRAQGASENGGNGSNGTQRLSSGGIQSRNAVSGLFATVSGNQSFQDSVIAFLRLLDVDLGEGNRSSRWRRDAMRLANKQGHTLLHHAVILGFHRLALDLIQRGCSINARDHNGYTALHFAALHGRVMIARMLIAHGANARIICEVGRDALDIAREHEQVDVECMLEDHLGLLSAYDVSEETDSDSDVSTHIDDDNVSSYVDELGDGRLLDFSDEESEEEEDESIEEVEDENDEQLRLGLHPALTASIEVGPDAILNDRKERSSEKVIDSTAKDQKVSDAGEEKKAAGFKELVFGGFDFANRARIGVPTVLHGGLPHFSVPVVSVFQMALPPSFTNWANNVQVHGEQNTLSTGSHIGDKSDTNINSERKKDNDSQNSASMWRNIFEESALWINPLSSPPPPSYESLTAPPTGQSLFPAIASTSKSGDKSTQAHTSVHQVIEQENDSTPTRSRSVSIDNKSLNHGQSSTSAISSNKVATRKPMKSLSSPEGLSVNESSSSRIKIQNKKSLRSRTPSLKDDRMLVYFWLPILVIVALLLCFAKPSTLFSYGDLMSFMPF